jgi:hypothetical protein
MSASDNVADRDKSQPDEVSPAHGRRPYVKPAFLREAVFETTALACGKVNPTVRQCNLVRKNS